MRVFESGADSRPLASFARGERAARQDRRNRPEKAVSDHLVARHEAAHAVIALRLGIAVDTINLDPDSAHVVTRHRRGRTRADQAKALANLAVVDLVGHVIEPEYGAADMRNAKDCCEQITRLRHCVGDGAPLTPELADEARRLLVGLRAHAAALVEKHRAEIEQLAAALATA